MIATNEELALLEKWKRKLCLQEWRIKLLQSFISASIHGNKEESDEN